MRYNLWQCIKISLRTRGHKSQQRRDTARTYPFCLHPNLATPFSLLAENWSAPACNFAINLSRRALMHRKWLVRCLLPSFRVANSFDLSFCKGDPSATFSRINPLYGNGFKRIVRHDRNLRYRSSGLSLEIGVDLSRSRFDRFLFSNPGNEFYRIMLLGNFGVSECL